MLSWKPQKFLVVLTAAFLLLVFSVAGFAQQSTERKEIDRLIEQLDLADEQERTKAVAAVANYGEAAVPALVKAFESDNVHIRRGAIYALNQIGERAIPAVLEALKSDSPQVRWTAATVFILSELSDTFVYREALGAALFEALQDPDIRVRNRAARALWQFEDENASPDLPVGIPEEHVGSLVEGLRDLDPDVRRSALQALSEAIEAQPLAPEDNIVSTLTEKLSDPDKAVRRVAAWMLGQFGEAAHAATPLLTELLADPEWEVRSAAAIALGHLGEPARGTILQLRSLLNDPKADTRGAAAIAMATLGERSEDVIRELRQAITDQDEDRREDVAVALAIIGEPARVAVPELRQVLDDPFPEVRRASARALGQIGEPAQAAIPELRQALSDRDRYVRVQAARALGRIGEPAQAALNELRQALLDKDPAVRAAAARALPQIGYEADDAIPELSKSLKDPSALVRKFSAEALAKIAISLEEGAGRLSDRELTHAISDLETAQESLSSAAKADKDNWAEYKNALSTVRLSLDALNAWAYGPVAETHIVVRVLQFLAAYVILLPLVWAIVLRVRPLWLFHINRALEPYEFMAPRAFGPNKFSTRYILLVGFYYYHPRVLDAWVKSKLEIVRETFENKPTVKSHRTYVPLPAVLGGHRIASLTDADVRPTFQKLPSCLLVWGEGGSGKTNIAVQVAHMAISEVESERLRPQPMLPILIEHELIVELEPPKKKGEDKGPKATPLTETVRGQLQDLTHATEPVSHEVLTALLRRQSLLVIIDGLSEMSEETRKHVRPDLPDFAANALVVTSRIEEPLGQVTKTTINLLRISANQFPRFFEDYVYQRGKAQLFESGGFEKACGQFTEIVGRHKVTVLLAELYADRTIAAAEGSRAWYESLHGGDMPKTTPELMLSYLNELNRHVLGRSEAEAEVQAIQHDAKVVAWECTKQALRPGAAMRHDILQALGGEDAAERLQRLERRLSLVHAVGVARDRFSFSHEILAEYLAAMHVVSMHGDDEQGWRAFLQQADGMPRTTKAIRSFLRAVKTCGLDDRRAPDFVVEELDKRIEGTATPAAAV